jgi:hypothetical protein
MFQTILNALIQRLHSAMNHLAQSLPTLAQSDTPSRSLRLHISASLATLAHPLLANEDLILKHMNFIALSTPTHDLIPDSSSSLITLTQHFTKRLLNGLHTILHIGLNDTYAQLAHPLSTLNTFLPSGIFDQI